MLRRTSAARASFFALALAACSADPLGTAVSSSGSSGDLGSTGSSGSGGSDVPDAGAAPALGANVTAEGVVFRVRAPHAAAAAHIAGDRTS